MNRKLFLKPKTYKWNSIIYLTQKLKAETFNTRKSINFFYLSHSQNCAQCERIIVIFELKTRHTFRLVFFLFTRPILPLQNDTEIKKKLS